MQRSLCNKGLAPKLNKTPFKGPFFIPVPRIVLNNTRFLFLVYQSVLPLTRDLWGQCLIRKGLMQKANIFQNYKWQHLTAKSLSSVSTVTSPVQDPCCSWLDWDLSWVSVSTLAPWNLSSGGQPARSFQAGFHHFPAKHRSILLPTICSLPSSSASSKPLFLCELQLEAYTIISIPLVL